MERGGSYEFDSEQNVVLSKTATWVSLFAWILIASSVLSAIGGVVSADEASIGMLIASGIYFIAGLGLRGSASSMKQVIETEGNDIEHLIDALDKLGSAFKTMGIVFLVGIVVFVSVTVWLWSWMAAVEAALR